MIVSINQPAYMPWLGYFHRIAASDVHVVLDHVQFEKNSMTNRNKVRTREGWSWLTVPVRTKGRFGGLAISAVEISDERFAKKHLCTLNQLYSKAPYFSIFADWLSGVYAENWKLLVDLNKEISTRIIDYLGIETKIVYSSDLGINSRKSDLVFDLCEHFGADVYLSGAMGRNYLDEASFIDAGIRVRYQDYAHPEYPQLYAGFESYMCTLDLLMNCGPASLEILCRNNPGKDELFKDR